MCELLLCRMLAESPPRPGGLDPEELRAAGRVGPGFSPRPAPPTPEKTQFPASAFLDELVWVLGALEAKDDRLSSEAGLPGALFAP